LQQAQYTTASKDAALYYEREARQKLNDVLDRASKTKMDDSQIIALLQQEIINNPSDANYLKLLTEHIEKKLKILNKLTKILILLTAFNMEMKKLLILGNNKKKNVNAENKIEKMKI